MKKLSLITAAVLTSFTSMNAGAQESNPQQELQLLLQQIEQLKQRVLDLEQKLTDSEVVVEQEDVQEAQNDPIRIGGAVRTQYVWEDYNTPLKDRGGDFDFDMLRI